MASSWRSDPLIRLLLLLQHQRITHQTPSVPSVSFFAASRQLTALQRLCSTSVAARPSDASAKSKFGIPLSTGRPRLVVLGTGWAAARLVKDINPKLYDITVISLRNHMVFTPLLASTTVGTLKPQSVAVHITNIQPALFQPQNQLYIAEAKAVDPESKTVACKSDDGVNFDVHYDVLAVATGSQGSTFNIPGVLEHANFLRDVRQAEAIHHKLTKLIAKAGIPGRPTDEYYRLLHIVIIGGGPTGVEVAGELSDFINEDLKKLYPDRARTMRVTLIEAKEVLGSFDPSLREYAARKLIRQGVTLRKGMVKEMDDKTIKLHDGAEIQYGLCIWSTGVGPTPFSTSLPFAKTRIGRLAIDQYLRVLAPPKKDGAAGHHVQAPTDAPTPHTASSLSESPSQGAGAASPSGPKDGGAAVQSAPAPVPDVYSLGDVSANVDCPLPALAQVAEQQGRYLASVLNRQAKERPGWQPTEGFVYKPLGSMASVGGHSAVLQVDTRGSSKKHVNLAGFWSWVAWRSAYLTRLGSVPKRMAVAFDWTLTWFFGRDMSRW